MQILASALPGFRELRAPLLAGYMWLIFVWILIKPDIRTRPHNAVGAAMYDLAKDAGPIWIGLGVGVAAYLLGSVSQGLSPLLSPPPGKAINAFWRHVPAFVGKRLRNRHPAAAELQEWGFDPIDQYFHEAQRKLPPEPLVVRSGFKFAGPRLDELLTRSSEASRGLEVELQLPATLLLTERGSQPDPQLFSEADRLKAERELRLAVVPPLFAIAIYLGCNQSSWFWLALFPIGVLLWQAHTRNQEFRSLMFGAVARGLARSRSVEEFKRWTESLPEADPDQKAATEATAPSAEESRLGGHTPS